jgi:ATP-dependent RNA helicase RhlE
VHRIGRTGRAGSSGAAVSLVDRDELPLLKDIERLMKRLIDKVEVPDFVPSAARRNPTSARPANPAAHKGKRGSRDRQAGPAAGEGQRQGKPRSPGQGAAQGQARARPGRPGPKPEQARRQGPPAPAKARARARANAGQAAQPGSGSAPRVPRAAPRQGRRFGNRVDYQPRARGNYRDPEANMGGHRHGNGSQGGNPNRGTPAALDEARRPAVTLTGRRPGDIKPAALFGPRGGGNGGNGGNR